MDEPTAFAHETLPANFCMTPRDVGGVPFWRKYTLCARHESRLPSTVPGQPENEGKHIIRKIPSRRCSIS